MTQAPSDKFCQFAAFVLFHAFKQLGKFAARKQNSVKFRNTQHSFRFVIGAPEEI